MMMKSLTAAALLALLCGCAQPTSYDGGDLFVANCSNCHGIYAEGDGPLAGDLSVALRDLRRIRGIDGTFPRGEVRGIIDGRSGHDIPDMPEWGTALGKDAPAKIEAILDFLQEIQLPPEE